MDPLTLFALANGAVSAVKAGCKLYKDIKGAAGEVKDVLKDLDSQFNKLYEGKPVPPAAKKQLQEEKARVVELNKKAEANEHTSIYTEIGNHLGTYYDNYYKCIAVFEEEERRSRTEVYHGEDSLGKRALQRVLLKKQLEHMSAELREIMVYQSPPELGPLYLDVEAMMAKVGKEQSIVIAAEMRRNAERRKIQARRRKRIRYKIMCWSMSSLAVLYLFWMCWAIVQIRIEQQPDLGVCFIPKGQWPYEHYNNLKWIDCEPRR